MTVTRLLFLSLVVLGLAQAAAVSEQHFFLPTGTEVYNVTDPTVVTDASGGTHMVYAAYAGGNAFYAHCASDCSEAGVSVVKLETDGTVDNVMLAVDAQGRPQVLMSTYLRIYYASCTGDCRQQASWTVSSIGEHGSSYTVTGEAFALDPQGRPRFMMHTTRTLFGIGQGEPETHYALCDADCHNSSSWQMVRISEQIWQESQLLFTSSGLPRLATVVVIDDAGGSSELAAYVECNGDCLNEANWLGTGLAPAYSDPQVARIKPAVSMSLTRNGEPRILMLAQHDTETKALLYATCDRDCSGDNWQALMITASERLGAGIDLSLDAQDRPRFVYTVSSSILLGVCDHNCTTDGNWNPIKVAFADELPVDSVPFPNCTVGAWFFRNPSLGIAPDGLPRIAYQAEDISGGGNPNPLPHEFRCVAGVDMTLSRYAQIPSYQ